jgi:uncharacterized damage-inducible protein DinB
LDQQVFVDALKYGVRISHTEEGWISPLGDVVKDVDFEAAKWKPGPHVASIWEILAHAIPYTESRTCDFTGAPYGNEDDWPEIADQTESAWRAMQARAEKAANDLQAAVDAADADAIGGLIGKSQSPRAGRLMDIIVHDAYHAGQIVKLQQAYAALGREVARA